MRDMTEELKNKQEKVGSFLEILMQEAFLKELGGDNNAEHFKLLGVGASKPSHPSHAKFLILVSRVECHPVTW